MKTILVTAGGTGGHVFPALAIANALIAFRLNIVWVGSLKGIENELVPKYGIKLEKIAIFGLRKKGLLQLIKLPVMIIKALYQAFKVVKANKPSLVISFGGYASFPVAIIARVLRIPLIIHEQNSVAGLTNKILAKFANTILVAYKSVLPGKKTILVGNPVRVDILQLVDVEERYGSRIGGLRILILGGSLGAKIFNDNLPYVFENSDIIESVIHQVGRGEVQPVQSLYNELKINASVVNFIDDMAKTYSEVDLIICRAGALTVSEVCVAGLAAIFIPYPHAVDDHQKFNAQPLVDCGAAFMLSQENFSIHKLAELINSLDRKKCLWMAIKARGNAILDSKDQIIKVVKQHLLRL
ncbi:MAG: undecaprenyldiphospho-muramoylpentapeptide beta-N-acetylglucosaminyltransferase [Burkholderiales bacterium]|nr:undecaprenyldiphospho-muramoylpentapeptide beta-N-acetylglucosaminyltransferase [Burkholderiales bacterium]